jgi:hypothetical protein
MRADAAIVEATYADAAALAASLRPEDAAELAAIGETDMTLAINRCMDASTVSFAAVLDGQVGAMFGCGPVRSALGSPDGLGWVWFITGKTFAQKPRPFARPARAVMAQLLERFPILVNYIDARYEAAVRWAKWLGFDVGAPVPYGPAGMLFHPARLEKR